MQIRFTYFIFILLFITGCSNQREALCRQLSKDDPHHIKYIGHFKTNKNVSIHSFKNKQRGVASWYGSKGGFHGKKTANGDKFNKNLLTAAHRNYPMPSLVKVTNLKNKKSLILMVNDRGPYAKNRIIDVSERAAEVLGFKKQGVANVEIQYLPNETKNFLKKISLGGVHGAKVKIPPKNLKCSINCNIKLINIKQGLAVNP